MLARDGDSDPNNVDSLLLGYKRVVQAIAEHVVVIRIVITAIDPADG